MSQITVARTTAVALVALLTVGLTRAAAQETSGPPQDVDFVYVNSQQILQQAPGASEAQQTWRQELEGYRSEVQELSAEIDSLEQSLESRRDMMNEQALQRREQELQQKRQELAQRAQQLEQQAAQRRDELLGPILQEVGTVIEAIRAENGYDMVFDITASSVQAAAPRLDITDVVLERLREQSAGGDAAPDGGSGF